MILPKKDRAGPNQGPEFSESGDDSIMPKRGGDAGSALPNSRPSSISGPLACLFLLTICSVLSGCATTSVRESELRYQAIFASDLGPDEVSLRWFGTAGYEIRYREYER